MQLLSPLHSLRKDKDWFHHNTNSNNNKQEQIEIAKEIEKRQGKSATYTQPLLTVKNNTNNDTTDDDDDTHDDEQEDAEYTADVQAFLTEFYHGGGIFERASSDMRLLLKQYPATIATHYALLVPNVVSFDQFWSRYYYRCSATTIRQEWRRHNIQHDWNNNDTTTSTKDALRAEDATTLSVSPRDASKNDSTTITPPRSLAVRRLLERGVERGRGVWRNYSSGSSDSGGEDSSLYQQALRRQDEDPVTTNDVPPDHETAVPETNAPDTSEPVSTTSMLREQELTAAARAQVFRSEDDTDIIETIVEHDENDSAGCVSEDEEEEDTMIGGGGAGTAVDNDDEPIVEPEEKVFLVETLPVTTTRSAGSTTHDRSNDDAEDAPVVSDDEEEEEALVEELLDNGVVTGEHLTEVPME